MTGRPVRILSSFHQIRRARRSGRRWRCDASTHAIAPAIALALGLSGGAVDLSAQAVDPPVSGAGVTMRAEARWETGRFLSPRASLAFELSRDLRSGERLAVLVGPVDVSATLDVSGRRVTYLPEALHLPAGSGEAVAYLVSDDGRWEEVGRAPLRVRSRAGLDDGRLTPSADLATSGQLDQYVADGDPPPDRRAYQDATLRLGLSAQGVRDAWEVAFQSNAVGASERTQRLRYGERQDRAAPLELADYQLQVRRGRVRAVAGNLSVGANRFLLAGFGSRGLSAGVQLHPAVSLEASAVNGTNVIGWDNLLGVSDGDHRLLSTALALEFVPSRPGALHLDVQALDGSLLPRTGYTQGAVTDAERSRGVGVQVNMTDPSQRVRLGAGITESRFRNPFDPLVAGDTALVATRSERRRARYGELGVQLLRDVPFLGSTRASLSATARHERVDPLYRSVGAYVQGDQQVDGGDVTASFGALAIQGALSRGRDNLAELPSLLTTRTTRRALSLAAPVHGLLGLTPRPWLPTATFAWEGTTQAGDGVPQNAEFQPTHVPDQYNRNRTVSASWTPSRVSLAYRWNESLQDNRQPGRERSDLRTRVHAVQLALSALPRLSPALEGSVERQQLFETGAQLRTTRLVMLWQAQPTRTLAFNGNVSRTWSWDPFGARRVRNLEVQGELSQGFTLYRAADGGSQGRVFVRYARTRAVFLPLVPDPTLVPRLMWTINAGSSFRFF